MDKKQEVEQEHRNYLQFIQRIEDLTYDYCLLTCHKMNPSIVDGGAAFCFGARNDCSDRMEKCITVWWDEYDPDLGGNRYNYCVSFPYRYLYEEDWERQEREFQQKKQKVAREKIEQQERERAQQEYELYQRLKVKYENTNVG